MDRKAQEDFGDQVNVTVLLRVVTEALNSLAVTMAEGTDVWDRLALEGEKELRDKFIDMEYATALLQAGTPDACDLIPDVVPYGDERDKALENLKDMDLNPRKQPALFIISLILSTIISVYIVLGRGKSSE